MTTIKIQYASDLHLEFPQNELFLKTHPLQPEGDILILAGDIIPFALMNDHNWFFDYISEHFKTTFWLPGNHEYYHFDAAQKTGTLHESIRSNVFLVNNICIQHQGVSLIFTTLWSHISEANQWKIERSMNDFRLIRYNGHKLTSTDYNDLHADSLSFLHRSMKESQEPTVVTTHHVPTFFNYPPAYKGDILNEAFATELFDLIESSGPTHWVYGHHHFNQPDFQIGTTWMCSNQLGYVQQHEHLNFSDRKMLS